MSGFPPVVWIGVRESELKGVERLFFGSITVYGSNQGRNIAFDKVHGYRFDCNEDCAEWITFVNTSCRKFIQSCAACTFMLYYPADYPYYDELVKKRVLFINDDQLISFFENKFNARLWANALVPLIPYAILSGRDITLANLQKRFPSHKEFVIQSEVSCSGNNTWLYSTHTVNEISSCLHDSKFYAISPYIRNNIPLNIHLIVYPHEVIALPASIQIISTANSRFSYKGADFIAYKFLSPQIREKVSEFAYVLGEQIRKMGYRGVCGIDFIATEQEIYFMEVNARFQASTMPINVALQDTGSIVSVQTLHMDAFSNPKCTLSLPTFEVHYSTYRYSYREQLLKQLRYFHKTLAANSNIITLMDDGLDWSAHFHEKAFVYKVLVAHNITAVTPENTVVLTSNLDPSSNITMPGDALSDLRSLKIMLLNQGIRVSQSAQQYADSNGGFNFEEFEALDMILQGKYINAPYNVELSKLSPFEIDLDKDEQYILKHWGNPLTTVTLRYADCLGNTLLSSGTRLHEIAYLGNDRLRIYHRKGCFYQSQKLGCKFCDVENCKNDFSFEDIKAALDCYKAHPSIRHYLIGGGSEPTNDMFANIIRLAAYIRETTGKPIYLMTTPPSDIAILQNLLDAGITEVAFNVEVFDRNLAASYMPGKGTIPLAIYEGAWREAVRLWGNTGAVRTAFIVGLESKASLLQGVEFVCRLGVHPILSLFKPIAGTALSHMLPPPNAEILDICTAVENLCKRYNTALSPSCRYCEDNTLKISL